MSRIAGQRDSLPQGEMNMNSVLKTGLMLVAVTALSVAPVLAGAEGRVAGTVVDPDGNPIVGAEIIVSAIGYDYEVIRTTNKKGRFTLLVMDATKDYRIRLQARR